jgi:hypothetical protein
VRDWRLLSKPDDGLHLEELACQRERRNCQRPRLPGAPPHQVSSSLASEHIILLRESDVNVQHSEPGGGVPQNNVLNNVVL